MCVCVCVCGVHQWGEQVRASVCGMMCDTLYNYREDSQIYLPVVCLDIRRVVDTHTERERTGEGEIVSLTHNQEISFRSPATCTYVRMCVWLVWHIISHVPILFVVIQLLSFSCTGPPNMISQETLVPEMLAECRRCDLDHVCVFGYVLLPILCGKSKDTPMCVDVIERERGVYTHVTHSDNHFPFQLFL